MACEDEGMLSQNLSFGNSRRKYFAKLGTVIEIDEGAVAPYLVELDEYLEDGLIAFRAKALTRIP